MEKILLAMDAAKLNMKTIDFACHIARLTRSRLTGVFLEGLVADYQRGLNDIVDSRLTESNIHTFREACVCRETLSRVHRDRGIPISEIIAETRFADLLIIDAETSFAKADRHIPGRFVKDALESAECPVLIAPYTFDTFDEIVFAYNGTISSVYAIKQFTAIFPQLTKKKVSVVNVRQDSSNAIEDQFRMKEWLNAHFDNVEFVILKGSASDQLFAWLIEKKNAVVVMGAYGRNILSRFFKPSQARLIVKSINLPIFITHQ
jgi:nucleotide-binding universal stress UspA family protein